MSKKVITEYLQIFAMFVAVVALVLVFHKIDQYYAETENVETTVAKVEKIEPVKAEIESVETIETTTTVEDVFAETDVTWETIPLEVYAAEPKELVQGNTVAEKEEYIEVLIDLSDQQLKVIDQDENVLIETGIVSGTKGTGRETPTGEYSIYSKETNRMLKHRWHVDYWMPFNGGIGIHDASWRTEDQFGTDQYTISGSHGCINVSPEIADDIYGLVSVGTKVTVVD